MSVAIVIDDLTAELGGTRVLDGVDLVVPAGSFVTLLGPSGSGKTTTLNVLAGFVERSGGHVRMGERTLDDVAPHARNIGMLFQGYALFPHMTVGENVGFPLRARRVGRRERAHRVNDALEMVRLPGSADRRVDSLSGGQQQRVALARALVFDPSLLLLDEPLAALDKQLRQAMQHELKRIQSVAGTTTIAVTHDQAEAMSMSDTVAIMNRGRIVQVGTPHEVYRRPADLFVAEFLGEANLVPVRDGRLQGLPHRGRFACTHGTAVVRPDDVGIADSAVPGSLPGVVEASVFQGDHVRMSVRCTGLEAPLVVSAAARRTQVAVGGTVHVTVDPDLVHVVPDASRGAEGEASTETESSRHSVPVGPQT